MKKILSITVALLLASALYAAPKAEIPQAAPKGNGQPPYHVDLKKITLHAVTSNPDKLGAPIGHIAKNRTPITKNWEDLMFLLPADMPDVTGYIRVTVTLKFYDSKNVMLVPFRDSMAMASMIYELDANWRADMGGNTVFKEFNVGGFSGMLHTDRGVRVGLSKNPKALLVQSAQDRTVSYIEVTNIIFHNGDFEFEDEQPESAGPAGT